MFRLRVWGVRGAVPSPLTPLVLQERIFARFNEFFEMGFISASHVKEFVTALPDYKLSGFGGNTSCYEVYTKESRIIIDAGTGLRELGLGINHDRSPKRKRECHIFLTHFHWDHIMGIPFFAPILNQEFQIHFYAVQPELEQVVRSLFRRPLFAIPFEELPSQISFHVLRPREKFLLGDFEITPYMLDHTDPCWGFRVEYQGRVYSHCVDTECFRVSRKDLGEDLALYSNVDLMVFDSQYSIGHLLQKSPSGHSSATIGLDLAIREGIKRVLFTHYNPNDSDFQIHRYREQTREYYEAAINRLSETGRRVHQVMWDFAREGTDIEIG